jgi:UDP-N-acetylmuramate--alanine ligase
LAEGLRARGHRQVLPLASPAALAATIESIAKSGDLVVCLGAGSITNWAANLPAEINQLAAGARP